MTRATHPLAQRRRRRQGRPAPLHPPPVGLLALLLLALLGPPALAAERRIQREVAPGLRLEQTIRDGLKDPLVVTALRVDLRRAGVRVETPLASGRVWDSGPLKGRAAVSAMAAREGAIAAVNADFFPFTGDPLGLCIHRGELLSEPNPARGVVGFTREGKPVLGIARFQGSVRTTGQSSASFSLPLSGLNRARGANELVLYSPSFGASTGTNALGAEAVIQGVPLPLRCGVFTGTVREQRPAAGSTPLDPDAVVISGHGTAARWVREVLTPGTMVEIRLALRSAPGSGVPDDVWCQVVEAAGGGPFLVRNGAAYIDSARQQMKPDVTARRAPRTALGVTRDGQMLLVAVDGRQPFSTGATLQELAQILLSLGAYNAMNLDGGGSTSMVLRGLVVNSPSGGAERPVANGIAVFLPDDGPAPDPGDLLPDPPQPVVTAGNTLDLRLLPSAAAARRPAPSTVVTAGGDSSAQTLTRTAGQPVGPEEAGPEGLTEPPAGTAAVDGAIWSKRGPGFVDQSGRFLGTVAGRTEVTARVGSREVTFEVTVVPGEPASLVVTPQAADPDFPDRVAFTVQALDAYKNLVPGRPVAVRVEGSGGAREPASVTLDERGTAQVIVEWQPGESGRRVTFGCGKASLRWTPPKPAVVKPAGAQPAPASG